MKRLAAVLLAVSLAGCTTYQGYGYGDDGYYDDRYYEGPDYYRGSAARDRYYYDDPVYSGYDAFGYGAYPYYYSSLWPIYHGYYDPFYNPYFHYGITYFPSSYFGFHYGGYGYPRYQPYAPYRYSWYDNYFGVGWYQNRRHRGHDAFGGQRSAFGSARNQAERMAAWTGADQVRRASDRGRGQRSIAPGLRSRGERGPALPQRSGPMLPSRNQSPAPRPRSRQYDRGGGSTPPQQANSYRPQSLRERSPSWQSEQRWSGGHASPTTDRVGRGRSASTGTLPALRPATGAPRTLTDPGGTTIPSRRSFRSATTPAPVYGGDGRRAAGMESRGSAGQRSDAPGRRYLNPSPASLPAIHGRGTIETRPQSGRAPPAVGAYQSPAPTRRAQSDFRSGGPTPAASQQRSYPAARSEPAPRAERSRRDDGGADDSERRKR